MRVHVALGSNLGDRVACIDAACEALRASVASGEFVLSPLYESDPVGPSGQPDYINAVCRFDTDETPSALLSGLQSIESAHGRVRPSARWGARTLDLDVLLYGERTIDTEDLVVPHPRIAEREFVLRPLVDLDPAVVIPGLGPASGLLAQLPATGLRAVRRAPGGDDAPPVR